MCTYSLGPPHQTSVNVYPCILLHTPAYSCISLRIPAYHPCISPCCISLHIPAYPCISLYIPAYPCISLHTPNCNLLCFLLRKRLHKTCFYDISLQGISSDIAVHEGAYEKVCAVCSDLIGRGVGDVDELTQNLENLQQRWSAVQVCNMYLSLQFIDYCCSVFLYICTCTCIYMHLLESVFNAFVYKTQR